MMKKNMFIISLTLLVGLFTISLFLMPLDARAKNIKVGVIDCYSGPAAVFGEDALNGFKLALKEINAQGVLGKKIEFTTRDSKFKVDLALNFAKELVLREDVDIIVGTINSGAAVAISQAVAKKEKVFISLSSLFRYFKSFSLLSYISYRGANTNFLSLYLGWGRGVAARPQIACEAREGASGCDGPVRLGQIPETFRTRNAARACDRILSFSRTGASDDLALRRRRPYIASTS